MQDAADWFDNTTVIDDATRLRIGRENAVRLFGLDGCAR
jgi:predicted TIM-barrel fold metal-dependent hydrolase